MSEHQYNTRSKAQPQASASLKIEDQSQAESEGVDNANTGNATTSSNIDPTKQDLSPSHDVASNLSELLFYQKQRMEDNRQLKQSLQQHELTIDQLVKLYSNLQTDNSMSPGHRVSVAATPLTTSIQSVSTGDHTTKQLRSKQLTHLFESKPFSGSAAQDVVDWLDEFNRKCDDIQLDDAQRLSIARDLMKDDAKLWVNTLKNVLVDWTTFQKKLISYFQLAAGLDSFSFSEQLLTRQQQLHESAIHYYHDIIRLCAKVDVGMDDLTRLRHLYRGLRPESKVLLSVEKFNKPEQFLQELVRIE